MKIHLLTRLIAAFLKCNPSPTDDQFHMLAEAAGIDHATLEHVAYAMLALTMERSQQEDEPGLLVDEDTQVDNVLPESIDDLRQPADMTVLAAAHTNVLADALKKLSDADLAIDGLDEYVLPYYDAALPDGSRNAYQTTEVQRDTKDDGGFKPYDQSATDDDGVLSPEVVRLVGTASPAETEQAAMVIQNLLTSEFNAGSFIKDMNVAGQLHTAVVPKDPLPLHDLEDAIDRTLEQVQILRSEIRAGKGYTVLHGNINGKPWAIWLQVVDRQVTQIVIQP